MRTYQVTINKEARMKSLKALKSVLFALLSCLLLLTGCGLNESGLATPSQSQSQSQSQPQSQSETQSPKSPAATAKLTTFEGVAEYIRVHHELPGNFITKAEAKKLGWDPQGGNLQDVAPGKSIGGDVFQNREKKLPSKKGRIWYEADINYKSGHRGKDRILFSSDGLIYKTEDHYETFKPIK